MSANVKSVHRSLGTLSAAERSRKVWNKQKPDFSCTIQKSATIVKQYYVYILASISKVLYIGVTNDLKRRVWEHKQSLVKGFTQRYHIKKLVYFENTSDVIAAIEREKQIKKWRREKKIHLIESKNPKWIDLYDEI